MLLFKCGIWKNIYIKYFFVYSSSEWIWATSDIFNNWILRLKLLFLKVNYILFIFYFKLFRTSTVKFQYTNYNMYCALLNHCSEEECPIFALCFCSMLVLYFAWTYDYIKFGKITFCLKLIYFRYFRYN